MKTYQNDHVRITLNANVHLLRQTWIGLPSSANFRTGSEMTMQLAKQHQIKRWLIDLRLLRLFSPMDLNWFINGWMPENDFSLPNNSRVGVLLKTTNQFSRLGIDLLMRAVISQNPTVMSRYFNDEAEAVDWLLYTP